MSDKLPSSSPLQEDILETIEILGKKAIQLDAIFDDSWGPSCIGFSTSDWNSIFGLCESEDFLTWRLDRNDFTMEESNFCLAGTVIYEPQELQGCLKRIQEICKKQMSGAEAHCLALIITRDSSQEWSDKLRETFRGLEKGQYEEMGQFFENIRVLPLPDLIKTNERRDMMSGSMIRSKIPILSKKIEKWGRSSEKKNVIAEFWKKKYVELESEHLQLCEELKKSQEQKKELEFEGKTLQRKIAKYEILEEERQLEVDQESNEEFNDGL